MKHAQCLKLTRAHVRTIFHGGFPHTSAKVFGNNSAMKRRSLVVSIALQKAKACSTLDNRVSVDITFREFVGDSAVNLTLLLRNLACGI